MSRPTTEPTITYESRLTIVSSVVKHECVECAPRNPPHTIRETCIHVADSRRTRRARTTQPCGTRTPSSSLLVRCSRAVCDSCIPYRVLLFTLIGSIVGLHTFRLLFFGLENCQHCLQSLCVHFVPLRPFNLVASRTASTALSQIWHIHSG